MLLMTNTNNDKNKIISMKSSANKNKQMQMWFTMCLIIYLIHAPNYQALQFY